MLQVIIAVPPGLLHILVLPLRPYRHVPDLQIELFLCRDEIKGRHGDEDGQGARADGGPSYWIRYTNTTYGCELLYYTTVAMVRSHSFC